MNCSNCGAYVGDEDVFCGECGQPVARPGPAEPGPSPEEVRDLETELLPAPAASPPSPPPSLPTALPAAPKAPGLKNRRWLMIAGVAATLLTLCICGALLGLYFIGRNAVTPTPDSEAAVVAPLYEESFDAESGWDVYDDEDTWAAYAEGGYRLGLRRADYVTWGNPEDLPQFTDFHLDVDAWQVEGPLDNNLGVLVRYQGDDDNFYWFQISSDGYYAVDLMQAGEWVSLVGWEASAAIQQGLGMVNHLAVECRGSEFDFAVNGTHLTTVSDANFASGSIGLAAGTFGEPGVVIQYDNLRLTELGE